MIPAEHLNFLDGLNTVSVIRVGLLRVYDIQVTPIFRAIIFYKYPNINEFQGSLITGADKLFTPKGLNIPNPIYQTVNSQLALIYGDLIKQLNELGTELSSIPSIPIAIPPPQTVS